MGRKIHVSRICNIEIFRIEYLLKVTINRRGIKNDKILREGFIRKISQRKKIVNRLVKCYIKRFAKSSVFARCSMFNFEIYLPN